MPFEQTTIRRRRALVTYFMCMIMLGFEAIAVVMLVLGHHAAWLAFSLAALVLSILAGWRMRQQRLADLRASRGEISA